MKKIFGYVVVIAVGVLGFVLMMERVDEINKLAKADKVELYS